MADEVEIRLLDAARTRWQDVAVMILGHLLMHALGRTRAGRFFNMAMFLLCILALPVGSLVGLSCYIWQEFAKESNYHQRFGEQWKLQYEAEQGSLTSARTKVVLAALATVANALLGWVIYRALIPRLRGYGSPTHSPGRRRWRHHQTRG